MHPAHPILPDASRYAIVALRWERDGKDSFLDLTLRHRDTSAVRCLRFFAPVDVHIDPDIDSYGMAISDVSARQMEGIGVEVYNFEGPGGLRFLARDVIDLTRDRTRGGTLVRESNAITVSELRRVTNLVFDRLEATGHETVDLTADHYWNIPGDRMYRPEPPPETSLDVGQLSSDWDELKEVGRGQDPIPSHDLAHLAAVLRFVATRIPG